MTSILSIDRLLRDESNRNRGTGRGRRAVKESLERFGAARSVVIDKHGNVICGNTTVGAALELGIDEVVVVKATGKQLVAVQRDDLDLTEKHGDARGLSIGDNRSAELGLSWEFARLAEDLKAGQLSDAFFTKAEFDAISSGAAAAGQALIDETRRQVFGGGIPETEGANDAPSGILEGVDPDDVPEDAEARCKPGDLWALGDHRLLCADSTETETLARLFQDEAPGLVFADPPYGISVVRGGKNGGDKPFGRNGGGGRVGNRPGSTVKAKRYAPIVGDDTAATAVLAHALCSERWPKAVQCWWGGNHYAGALPSSRCWLIWDKQTTGDFADAELGWTNQDSPIRTFRHLWNGLCKASERNETRTHPTQKPVALAEWVFAQYGAGVSLIFDPFLGSGMSLIAAEKTGRRCYGCELSPEYCDVILARYEKLTGKEARCLD